MTTRSVPPALEAAFSALRPKRIEAHLRFLAHPLLEGRGSGSRGGRLAEEYIRAVLGGAGLDPAPGLGYRQEVPMIGMTPHPTLAFRTTSGFPIEPGYRDDYVLEAGAPREELSVRSDLIFAGFGIHAPEYGWDDYGEVDVRGKVLLIRVNDPGTADRPGFFEGHRLTYYGRWTYKFEEASRRGALGAILIHTDESAGYGWNVVRNSNTGEQYSLSGEPAFPLEIRGWVTESVARSLLEAGDGSAGELLRASETGEFRALPLGVTVEAAVKSEIREVTTANVLGVLRGHAFDRTEEPIILMAHHDHLGVVTEGDSRVIYPGAHDNASGVAVLLSLAEALRETNTRFPRPVLFLASTAEESGLLGAEWYTRHPAWPLARTAAVLNLDGANLHGPTHDIAPLGMDRSTLGSIVRAAAEEEGLEVTPEQHPEKGMFFRQDHFPFARAGIPGIAFDHGLRFREKPEGWGEEWYQDWIARHYHQPSDAFQEDFDYRGAIQQARVMLRTTAAIAAGTSLPDWSPDSSFRRPVA